MRTKLVLCSTLAMLLAEHTALALQGGEDPALLPVLIDKRFGEGGRHQIGLSFSTTLAAKFVEQTGAYLTYAYGFSDLFALEINGGYLFGSESSIMTEVREANPDTEPLLSDLYQMQWLAGADLMLVPVYGKMSFASEFDPAFDLFLVAGGGVAGVRRQFGFGDTKNFDTKVTPAFNFGLGFRFYFNKLIALRVEFRDFFYPEPADTDTGLTFNLQFHAGLQLSFGGGE